MKIINNNSNNWLQTNKQDFPFIFLNFDILNKPISESKNELKNMIELLIKRKIFL